VDTPPRYDGLAGWYDEHLAEFTLAAGDVLDRLLGPGPGRCLDLCCGTGLHLPRLLALGWTVSGVDISPDQLSRARERVGEGPDLVEADATALPFGDGHFDAVVSMLSHTDVDDFPALVREASRVLRSGGAFVYAGVHSCFVGPHSRLVLAEEVPMLYPGYRETRRYDAAPGISPDGLRAKVGATHLPLEEFMRAFLDAPLTLDAFEEHGDGEYPVRIALRARASAS
jgi:SAM-dependent methyltransferase